MYLVASIQHERAQLHRRTQLLRKGLGGWFSRHANRSALRRFVAQRNHRRMTRLFRAWQWLRLREEAVRAMRQRCARHFLRRVLHDWRIVAQQRLLTGDMITELSTKVAKVRLCVSFHVVHCVFSSLLLLHFSQSIIMLLLPVQYQHHVATWSTAIRFATSMAIRCSPTCTARMVFAALRHNVSLQQDKRQRRSELLVQYAVAASRRALKRWRAKVHVLFARLFLLLLFTSTDCGCGSSVDPTYWFVPSDPSVLCIGITATPSARSLVCFPVQESAKRMETGHGNHALPPSPITALNVDVVATSGGSLEGKHAVV